MTRTLARLAAICCGLLLFACGGATRPQPTSTAEPAPPATITIASGQPIVIGVSAALSGDQAALGNDLADAAELAVSDYGGTVKDHPIRIDREDDRCTEAEKATQVARKLIAEAGFAGVVGPMCTTGAQAADALYEAAQAVHISPSVTRTDLSAQGERFFFRVAWRDDVQAAVQSAYAANTLHARSVALIDDGEPYGKALADAFATSFQQAGGNVMSRDRIDPASGDYSALARQVKSANPDAVVFEGLDPGGVLVLKALHDATYTGTFIAPDGLLSVRDFIVAGGAAAEGAIVTGGPMLSDLYIAHFQQRFQRVPTTPFVLQTSDAVTILLRAIDASAVEGAGGALVIDRGRLAEALHSQTFNVLTGSIQFDENGDRRGITPASAGLAIYRVTNGRFQPVP